MQTVVIGQPAEDINARLEALAIVHGAMNKRSKRISQGTETLLFVFGTFAVLGVLALVAIASA